VGDETDLLLLAKRLVHVSRRSGLIVGG